MTITRRDLFRVAAATGIASVFGVPESSPVDVFTLADLLNAERIMNEHAACPFGVGCYRIFVHIVAREDITLGSLTFNASYRVRETAWSLMRHERCRETMGKRGHVTAEEMFARVAESHVDPMPVPVA